MSAPERRELASHLYALQTGGGSVLSALNLLLVDDEKRILEVYSALLRDCGYSVGTASDPADALLRLSEEKFHIAIIDQYLGRTTGLELMEEMSGRDPGLYFVMITANNSADLAVEAMKRGASDFIGKPFQVSDLIRSIEYVAKKMELERQKNQMVMMLEKKVDEKTEELRKLFLAVLATLAQAMEKKDTGTYGHCRRVSQYAGLIASVLDLGDEETINLKAAAMLHDIGKIGISDFVLAKPGPLSRGEKDIIRNHPVKGVEILKPIKQFAPLLPAILHHHESFDGSGYPEGLLGSNIPLPARIIAVADTFDAVLSDRTYRPAADLGKAVLELRKGAGSQFDPSIVSAFVEAEERYRELFGGKQSSVAV